MNLIKKAAFCCTILSYTGRSGDKYTQSFLEKKTLRYYLNAFLICAAVSASTSCVTSNFFPPKYISDSFVIGIK